MSAKKTRVTEPAANPAARRPQASLEGRIKALISHLGLEVQTFVNIEITPNYVHVFGADRSLRSHKLNWQEAADAD